MSIIVYMIYIKISDSNRFIFKYGTSITKTQNTSISLHPFIYKKKHSHHASNFPPSSHSSVATLTRQLRPDFHNFTIIFYFSLSSERLKREGVFRRVRAQLKRRIVSSFIILCKGSARCEHLHKLFITRTVVEWQNTEEERGVDGWRQSGHEGVKAPNRKLLICIIIRTTLTKFYAWKRRVQRKIINPFPVVTRNTIETPSYYNIALFLGAILKNLNFPQMET